MTYELKSVRLGSVFINCLRVFLIVGLLWGIAYFILFPNAGLRLNSAGAKLVATVVFTLAYGVLFSAFLTLLGFLYNLWARRFSGIALEFETAEGDDSVAV
jgi:hypothetical protein